VYGDRHAHDHDGTRLDDRLAGIRGFAILPWLALQLHLKAVFVAAFACSSKDHRRTHSRLQRHRESRTSLRRSRRSRKQNQPGLRRLRRESIRTRDDPNCRCRAGVTLRALRSGRAGWPSGSRRSRGSGRSSDSRRPNGSGRPRGSARSSWSRPGLRSDLDQLIRAGPAAAPDLLGCPKGCRVPGAGSIFG
jgi:hypothetical protein